MGIKLEWYNSYSYQIEVLPRFTILYTEDIKVVSFEWLFWGIYIRKEINN